MASLFDFINSRWDDVIELTLEHLRYVVSVVVVATIIGVATGIYVRHRPAQREIVLGVYAVFLTIPSLGLFVLFIPIVGLGFWGPFIALTMYALLPIARNTVTGLMGVDQAVLESARGMGLSSRQRLMRVQLPLAWPVIITGVRVSALLTTGIAAIATLVAGGGLGDFIKSGLSRLGTPNSLESVWTGTIFIILLALIVDSIFVIIRRATTSPGIR
ncbi:MAG TPA: ABC transporter permease [Acidimicrobiia bacterium]|jgi:osmoprotectant transport system permease protein